MQEIPKLLAHFTTRGCVDAGESGLAVTQLIKFLAGSNPVTLTLR